MNLIERIVVVGTSGCGKTTFAAELARELGYTQIELDSLFWGPGWTLKPKDEFRRLTEIAASEARWVADGDYGSVRDILWPRATTIIWLNYDFLTVLLRALRRTISRAFTGEELWHGNRESFRQAFLSRESIIVWVITTFKKCRAEYRASQIDRNYSHLAWIEFRRPAEAAQYLASIRLARLSPPGLGADQSTASP